MTVPRRDRPIGGREARRFTVPDEPALEPEKVVALRDARLLLQLAARSDGESSMIPALRGYVRVACAAGFARLTVRHTVAAALLPVAGRDEARRRRVQQWLGYVDRLYDRLAPR